MPELRRSTRPKTPTQKVLESTILSGHVEKRRSSRIAALKTAPTKTKSKSRPAKLELALTDFIVNDHTKASNTSESDADEEESDSDPGFDTDSGFDTDCPSSPDGEEFDNLSGDNIEYMAADDLGRRNSYDSRLESGNEEYERDDFVVDDDDESDIVSEAGSEVTITQEFVNKGRRDSIWASCSSSSLSSASEQFVERMDSITSRSSSSSGLFVTDDDEACGASLELNSEVVFKVVDADVDPADIAEEIIDAVSRFSRRCNRHCEPLRFDLSAELFADDEVVDAMHLAVKQIVGMYEKVERSRVLCTVGPRK